LNVMDNNEIDDTSGFMAYPLLLWASLKNDTEATDRHENHHSCGLTVLNCSD
jgi:hypothetical protein